MLEKKAHWFFNIFIFWKSLKFAAAGIWWALKYNQNLRFHFAAIVLVVIVSIILHVSAFDVGILSVIILIVVVTEMINTVVEEMVDLITKEHRQEAKIAKDVAAGMVLMASIGSVFVGLLVFVPHIVKFFTK